MKLNFNLCTLFAIFWVIGGIFCKEDSAKQIIAFVSANVFIAGVFVIQHLKDRK